MKIAILSFPGSPSHGAALQMYSLYCVLSNLGQKVEVINYIPDNVNHKRIKYVKNLRSIATNTLSKLFLKNSKPLFIEFEKQIKKFPSNEITTTEQLSQLSDRYDRIFVGSDQVWNPVVTGNDFNFYLQFCEDCSKKASYAPSFGVSNVREEDREKIASLLSEFSYLSVREKRGAEIIKELTGRDAIVVLDPTMLISKQVWAQEMRPFNFSGGRYVLFYTIKPSPALKIFAQQLANKHGCKLVTVGGRLREKFQRDKYPVYAVGPAELIGLIDSAEYVVTNSFHGTAFSVIMQKNFYVEYSSDTNSRLTNVINMFGLQKCVVGADTLSKEPVQVDYEEVDKVLRFYREKSLNYLKEAIGE